MDPQLLIALMSLVSTIYTNQSNRQLADEQRQWSEDMQDKQNQFNEPAQQVARLREAGISPASLSMGNGMQVSGNTSAPVNAYERAQVLDPMQMASNSFLSMMQGMKSEEERKDINTTREARIENLRQQSAKYQQEIAMLGLDMKAQEIANEYAAQLNEVALMKDLSEIGLNESQAKNLESLTDKNIYELQNVLPKELQILCDKHELNVLDQQKVVAEIQRIYAEKENIEADTALKDEQTITEGFKQAELGERSLLEKEQTLDVKSHVQMYLDHYEDYATQISNETKMSTRNVKAFWINMILHGAKDAAVSTGASLGGAAAVVKAAAAM